MLIIDPGFISRFLWLPVLGPTIMSWRAYDWMQQDWSSSRTTGRSSGDLGWQPYGWSDSAWPDFIACDWEADKDKFSQNKDKDSKVTLGLKHPLTLDERKDLVYRVLTLGAPDVCFPRIGLFNLGARTVHAAPSSAPSDGLQLGGSSAGVLDNSVVVLESFAAGGGLEMTQLEDACRIGGACIPPPAVLADGLSPPLVLLAHGLSSTAVVEEATSFPSQGS